MCNCNIKSEIRIMESQCNVFAFSWARCLCLVCIFNNIQQMNGSQSNSTQQWSGVKPLSKALLFHCGLIFFFSFVVQGQGWRGIELRTSHMLDKCSATESDPSPRFSLVDSFLTADHLWTQKCPISGLSTFDLRKSRKRYE